MDVRSDLFSELNQIIRGNVNPTLLSINKIQSTLMFMAAIRTRKIQDL